MSKREKVLVPATSGQVGEIAGALIGEMNFSKIEAEAIVGKMGLFRQNVRRFYSPYRIKTVSLSPDLLRWSDNYFKLFNRRPDLSTLRVPEKPEGFGSMRLVVVAREILDWTENHPFEGVQEALKKHFPGLEYIDDLDADITTNDRDPKNGSYAVWVRDTQEPDEEFVNRSANDLKAENHTGIIVLERQLFEWDFFSEKGDHLDKTNITLCTGSRSSDGGVPGVSWIAARLDVDRYGSAHRHSALRSRRVWALPAGRQA